MPLPSSSVPLRPPLLLSQSQTQEPMPTPTPLLNAQLELSLRPSPRHMPMPALRPKLNTSTDAIFQANHAAKPSVKLTLNTFMDAISQASPAARLSAPQRQRPRPKHSNEAAISRASPAGRPSARLLSAAQRRRGRRQAFISEAAIFPANLAVRSNKILTVGELVAAFFCLSRTSIPLPFDSEFVPYGPSL